MNTNFKNTVLAIFTLMSMSILAQEKKVHIFTIEKTITASTDSVWAVVGEDFGAIANSHPKIVSSNYINGSLKAEEGTERVCNFNEKGTKFTHEKIVEYNPKNYTMKVKVFNAEGVPMNTDYSYATYAVIPIDETSCKVVFTMEYRTKPAFLGGMAKGGFKKTIFDYLLAIEHNVLTGESVTKDNFKAIKKLSKS